MEAVAAFKPTDPPLQKVVGLLAVIATEGGGTNEVIEDGKNGFLIEHKGTDQLVEKLLFLYNNPEISRQMGGLQRDRKRLREYYTAISREASTPNRRTKTIPSSDEIESRERAVKLELKRKLAELEDRYLFEATVKPIAFVECVIPSVAIEVEIQRKSATRTFRVYWNGLLKVLEPLQCSRCGIGGFNFWFTNEKVEPICKCCHGLSAAT